MAARIGIRIETAHAPARQRSGLCPPRQVLKIEFISLRVIGHARVQSGQGGACASANSCPYA
jgi:hypothetical protein